MRDNQTEALVRQSKERDPDAFTALMDSQMQGMYKIARSILQNDEDAADAIQETILNCWEKLGTLRSDQYFKTWMTRILINNCYSLLRQKRGITYMDELPEISAGTDSYSFEWEEALSGLTPNYRLVILLYYVQGFRTREIAGLLGIPDNTVRTKLSRAREQLKKYYKEQRA